MGDGANERLFERIGPLVAGSHAAGGARLVAVSRLSRRAPPDHESVRELALWVSGMGSAACKPATQSTRIGTTTIRQRSCISLDVFYQIAPLPPTLASMSAVSDGRQTRPRFTLTDPGARRTNHSLQAAGGGWRLRVMQARARQERQTRIVRAGGCGDRKDLPKQFGLRWQPLGECSIPVTTAGMIQ